MEKTRIKTKALLPARIYRLRVVKSSVFSLLLLVFSLGIGIVGYKHFCHFSWTDALLNASMILTGMGPVNDISTSEGKIFASFYALYSGIAFLTIFAVFFSPIFHNFLHRFHLDVEENSSTD
ncbi:MAG TPA: hypothetical protein PLI68_06925 [Bacteroidia bacterium]|nr:hypothetical protein [Bacteroidia bacterium]HRH08403.1 hypothetical protein [Bacteroidia bacterium]HRH63042.1 hypothetical protein [Bacteroidia bacterium]